ncbi:ATPase, T2SS/T4P/T4SS family [Aliikangiella coralliicola]|uniref:Response regulator n=1 Tax=Aliikangiella coralliicola TaxID=2592383 RepID=A0A545TS19_9GAMM|nr:ATPase, T2SS/T4P/T4SS family [Aliikangiella coralliicola]TQV80020.1 response regulator [Aliikangiella coralliicola]
MSNYSELFTGKKTASAVNGSMPSTEISKYQILLLDDERHVLKSLTRVFRKENYTIITSDNPMKALAILRQKKIQLVISDFKMPLMNGAEFLRKVKKSHPDVIRIMLTGQADTQAVMTAINEGAVYKFILKPWNDDDLRISVSLALEQYDLRSRNHSLEKENKRYQTDLSKLSKMATINRSQLLITLNKKGIINETQVQQILKRQMASKSPPIKIILRQGWITEKEIRKIIKNQFYIEQVSLDEFDIDPAVTSLIPASFCKQQLLLPIRQVGKTVTLVMADPLDEGVLENVRFSSGLDFNVVMASCGDIEKKILDVFGDTAQLDNVESITSYSDSFDSIEIVIDEEEDIELATLLESTSEPPAIRLANALILEAIRLNASDIHIQPTSKYVLVRFRIDGVLHDKIQVPLNLHMALVSRIKIMAELDITERRRPQDGRITVKSSLKIVDLRLSTLPTINGEKIVMRLLDRNSSMLPLNDLGFSKEQLAMLELVSTKPQGIILTTGPTGSGKTTTLYSLLKKNATAEKNYITIEDPVEYYMDRAGQVMVQNRIDFSFSTALRAVLRQDPDTILLGEIRDSETANIAFQAALTGHVVYSTIHTNSSIATLARLFDLGLRPYIIASALEMIIAQRLVRKLCQHCKQEREIDKKILTLLGDKFAQLLVRDFQSPGCEFCQGTGLKGRLGIYEVFVLDEKIRQAITERLSFIELTNIAKSNGLKILIEDAADKVNQGLISADEVLRVLGAQSGN